ncbi:MAG: universal stress protein [Deltaproteobacteria bacterium]|nr:universal stress protein [Deltaproteobacteria bacterium]
MNVKVNSILCAVDFSKFSQPVLDYASGLARGFGADLIVFHALNIHRTPLPDDAVCTPGPDEVAQAEGARTRIAQLVGNRPVNWRTVIRSGDPVAVIDRYVRDHDIGIVVAASYGLPGWKRLLGGTIVEALARTLARPLLVVRASKASGPLPTGSPDGFALQNILVACDLSAAAESLYPCAAAFARSFNARLHFAHAVETPVSDRGVSNVGPYTEAQLALKDHLHARLVQRLPEPIRRDTCFKVVVLQGNPADSLMDYAAANAVELIIVGVRPRHGFQKLFIGSTTETLLRHAPCDVLALPYQSVL